MNEAVDRPRRTRRQWNEEEKRAIVVEGWLADLLSRVAEHKINRIDDLLPWHYPSSFCQLI